MMLLFKPQKYEESGKDSIKILGRWSLLIWMLCVCEQAMCLNCRSRSWFFIHSIWPHLEAFTTECQRCLPATWAVLVFYCHRSWILHTPGKATCHQRSRKGQWYAMDRVFSRKSYIANSLGLRVGPPETTHEGIFSVDISPQMTTHCALFWKIYDVPV